MHTNLQRLSATDGTWQELVNQWQAQCSDFEENFEDYRASTIGSLEKVANSNNENRGAFGLRGSDGVFLAVCFLNLTVQKGFDGAVLRVLDLIVAPRYDFQALELADYSSLLAALLARIYEKSNTTMLSRHIKLHFPSPTDVALIAPFGTQFADNEKVVVQTQGMWLSITKN